MAVYVPQHECRESPNPRSAGYCSCGERMPAKPQPVLRSLEYERGVLEQACKGYVDPSDILERSERRSLTLAAEYVANPMHIQPGRNRRREAREEIEDAVNHLRFDSQEHLEDEERCWENLEALRGLCVVYDRIKDHD